MAFIQREWKTWVKTEFLTGLKSLLSFTSFEAVSHYLLEMEFKFKNHNVNYSGRGVILCTHNGDNLDKTIAGNFWGRSEGRYSGHGTLMVTSGAYASYQKDFGCLTGTIKTSCIMGILRVFFKNIFKKSQEVQLLEFNS